MLASLTIDYFSAQIIEKGNRKLGLMLSISTNLLFLFFFKYYNFIIESLGSLFGSFGYILNASKLDIALPLGISFYTFQSMSYTIDVYYNRIKANKNYLQFATYVTMFPQLVAGPIVRYSDVVSQLTNKNISTNNFYTGVRRFIIGLSKKMIIANGCAYIADNIFAMNAFELSTPIAWLGIIAYSFQIYFDFSGYSDMAIGLGKMLGFDIPENFNFPYIAKSIREFWRRWHISLSTWFRDYLYIPLGGSRKGRSRTYVNLIIVFFITGLWHGASWNFVIWGLFHGFFMIIERMGFERILQRCWTPIQHFYTLFVVVIAWVLFKADDLGHALDYISRLFTFSHGNVSRMDYAKFFYLNNESILILSLAVIFSLPVAKFVEDKFSDSGKRYVYLEGLVLIGLFIISVSFIANDSYNPFIYFRF